MSWRYLRGFVGSAFRISWWLWRRRALVTNSFITSLPSFMIFLLNVFFWTKFFFKTKRITIMNWSKALMKFAVNVNVSVKIVNLELTMREPCFFSTLYSWIMYTRTSFVEWTICVVFETRKFSHWFESLNYFSSPQTSYIFSVLYSPSSGCYKIKAGAGSICFNIDDSSLVTFQ